MNDQEILEKAIKKAIDGGWPVLQRYEDWNVHLSGYAHDRYVLCLANHDAGTKWHIGVYEIIFDHDFAKALWSNEDVGLFIDLPKWKFRLQQMVIAARPVKYLEENI